MGNELVGKARTIYVDHIYKHIIELFFVTTIAFMGWEGLLLLEVLDRLTVVEVTLVHVDKAVNNVGDNEATLRELVQDNKNDLLILKTLGGVAEE